MRRSPHCPKVRLTTSWRTREALKNVLLYDVVQDAEVKASDVVGMTSATMANGDTVSIKVVDGWR